MGLKFLRKSVQLTLKRNPSLSTSPHKTCPTPASAKANCLRAQATGGRRIEPRPKAIASLASAGSECLHAGPSNAIIGWRGRDWHRIEHIASITTRDIEQKRNKRNRFLDAADRQANPSRPPARVETTNATARPARPARRTPLPPP